MLSRQRSSGWFPPNDSHAELGYLALVALVAVAFYVTPSTLISLVLLLPLVVLTYIRLDLALLVIPAFAPLSMQPKMFGHFTFVPSEIFIGVDLVVAAAVVLSHRLPRADVHAVLRSRFVLPAALFLVGATLSTAFAFNRHLALHAYRERVIDPLVYVVLLLCFVRERRYWVWLCGSIVAGGVAVGAIGTGQFLLQRDLSTVTGTGIRRVQALYGSPDNLGLLFDRVVPMWLAFAMAARTRTTVLIAVVAGLLLVPPFILTFSVGAWIAVAVALCFILVACVPHGRWILPLAVLVALAGVTVKHRAISDAFQSGHARSSQTRVDVWRSSVAMIRDYPLVGIGPDNFQRLYAPTLRQDKYVKGCSPGAGYMQPGAGAEPCLSHPHNEILDFWLSTGLLGVVSYAWLLIVFAMTALYVWSKPLEKPMRYLVLGASAAMVAGIVHGAIDNSYFLADLSLLFWTLCAVLSFMGNDGKGDATVPRFARAAYRIAGEKP